MFAMRKILLILIFSFSFVFASYNYTIDSSVHNVSIAKNHSVSFNVYLDLPVKSKIVFYTDKYTGMDIGYTKTAVGKGLMKFPFSITVKNVEEGRYPINIYAKIINKYGTKVIKTFVLVNVIVVDKDYRTSKYTNALPDFKLVGEKNFVIYEKKKNYITLEIHNSGSKFNCRLALKPIDFNYHYNYFFVARNETKKVFLELDGNFNNDFYHIDVFCNNKIIGNINLYVKKADINKEILEVNNMKYIKIVNNSDVGYNVYVEDLNKNIFISAKSELLLPLEKTKNYAITTGMFVLSGFSELGLFIGFLIVLVLLLKWFFGKSGILGNTISIKGWENRKR